MTDMYPEQERSTVEHDVFLRRLVIAPNASLSVAQAQWFFIGMCLVSLSIAGFFAALGLWLVFPFAGLEMAALGTGLYMSLRENGYREVVSMSDDRIEIEAGLNRPERRWGFPRLLTRVHLAQSVYRNGKSRLLITRHGHGCELGRCLTQEEREEVADQLKAWVTSTELR